MYYYLPKVVWFLLEPSNLLVLGVLAGLILGRRWPVAGRRLALTALAGLLIAGFSPIGTLLLGALEDRFPAYEGNGKVAGAIILGGASDPDVTRARGQLALGEAGERIVAMIEIARRFPQARIVFTGGSGELVGVESEAVALQKVLPKLAPDLAVTFETASRNTVENAQMTRALIQPRPDETWLLVTSAWHMPRSVGIFRKAGFAVVAYPVDFRTVGDGKDYRPFTSLSLGLRQTDLAAKEWVGILFAWLTGRSSALLARP